MRLRSAAVSDLGRVRRENQDRVLHRPELNVFGVADGIGGLPGGAAAAQATVTAVMESLALQPRELDLDEVVGATNAYVCALGHQLSPQYGIGSTLTLGVIRNDRLHLAHVGDSRCYLWRRGHLTPLTLDHSVENEAKARRARGEFVEPYDERSGQSLTRCIGQMPPPVPDLSEIVLTSGDRVLFATDGIARAMTDPEIALALGTPSLIDPARVLDDLVFLANERGGHDNATGVLVVIDEF